MEKNMKIEDIYEIKKLYYFYERIGKAAEELMNKPPLD